MYPKVSVILPVYNSEEFIKETIKSALSQIYKDFEIIVVNDGSTDKSEEIIKSFSDKRITCVYQENQGRSKARNKGISLAKGKYIAFLDSDDIWLSKHLEVGVGILEARPEVCVVYSDITYIGDDGKPLFRDSSWKGRRYSGTPFGNLVKRGFIPFSTSIIKRETLMEIGLFDSEMEPSEDWDLWLRLVRRNYRIQYIDEALTNYRWKSSNESESYQKISAESGLRVLIKLYRNENFDEKTLLFWKKGYLLQINDYIPFASRKSSFLHVKRYLGQYPDSFLALLGEPVFWRIVLKWILGKKVSYLMKRVHERSD